MSQEIETPSGVLPSAGATPAGETHATTEAHDDGHHGPTLLGLGAEGWVYTGVTIFILLAVFVFKAHKMVAGILDEKIADTRRNLDEAAKLRAEAEAILADAKSQQKAAKKDAQSVLDSAEAEASNIIAKAEADAKQVITRRSAMAEAKIAAAELAAIADVRAKVASVAAAAAGAIIAEKHDSMADKSLVDASISALN